MKVGRSSGVASLHLGHIARRLAAVILATLVLAACAAAPKTTRTFDGLVSATPDEAVVYVFREKRFVGGGMWYELYMNGKLAGFLSNGSYTIIRLSPGRYTMSNRVHPGLNAPAPKVELELAGGDVKFLMLRIAGGSVSFSQLGGTPVATAGPATIDWVDLSRSDAESVLFYLRESPRP